MTTFPTFLEFGVEAQTQESKDWMASPEPLLPALDLCFYEIEAQSSFFSAPRNQEFPFLIAPHKKAVLRHCSPRQIWACFLDHLPTPTPLLHSLPLLPPQATTWLFPSSLGFPFPWNLNIGSLTLDTCKGFLCSAPPWSRKPQGAPPDSVTSTSSSAPISQLGLWPSEFGQCPRERSRGAGTPSGLSGCPASAALGLPPHTTHHRQATWPWDQYSPAHMSCQSKLCSK